MITNQYNSPWNPDTTEGQQNRAALRRLLPRLSSRGELRVKASKSPILRKFPFGRIQRFLEREQRKDSEIGKIWAKIPGRPNILQKNFPNLDPQTRVELIRDLQVKTRQGWQDCKKKYPQLAGFNSNDRERLRQALGIETSPQNGIPKEELDAQRQAVSRVDAAIDERVAALVADGVLHEILVTDVEPHKIDEKALYQRIMSEFTAEIEEANFTLTEEYFHNKLKRIVWTSGPGGTLTTLRDFIEKGVDLESFPEYFPFPHIPQVMVLEEIQEQKGTTNLKNPHPFTTTFLPGIGRLFGDEDIPQEEITSFQLPDISAENPFEFPFADPRNLKMGVINGPQLGLLHSPLIEQNTIRRAFAYAERKGWEALILTGMFDLDTKKADGSATRGVRALYSGRNTSIDVLDPAYQEEATRIISAIKENEFTSEIIYETAKEAAKNLLSGWWKISLVDKTPEFSGKVLVVLGPKEFEVIMAAAHAEILYITIRKQGELRVQRMAAASVIGQHQKSLRLLEDELAICERDRLLNSNPATRGALETQCQSIRQKIEGMEEVLADRELKFAKLQQEEARTRMTNVRPEDWQRFQKLALALISLLIERAIPNSQVISLGTTYIKVGPEPKDAIKIVIPGHVRVTDGLVSEYALTYAQEALSMKMPETIIICHPGNPSFSMTAREVDAEGKRAYAPRIYGAPICVDGKFMREKGKQIIKRSHPIAQMVNHPFFQGGILEITATDGMVNVSPVTVEALGYYEQTEKRALAVSHGIADKHIWIMVVTDPHHGGRPKEYVWSPELEKSLGMGEAVFHLMRKAGYGDEGKLPPFNMFVMNDDALQGHHFDASKEPDRHEMPYHIFEQELAKLNAQLRQARRVETKAELRRKIQSFSLRQVRVRGSDSYTRQMDDFIDNFIEANTDMFSGMLLRSTRAGLILKPVSEFEDYLEVPYDTSDLGLINNGTGNHGLHTTDDNFSEGWIHSKIMRAFLLGRPAWAGQGDLLKRLVKGPVFGNKFIAFGTLQAPGGEEWAFDLRNSPSGNSLDWGNPARAAARNALRRGNYSRIFEKKMIIRLSGDKHILGVVLTSFFLEIVIHAGTHTDGYGERGFAPNNTGVFFLGLPTEGPASGPILMRPLFVQQLRDYIEINPRLFPFEELLPNPL